MARLLTASTAWLLILQQAMVVFSQEMDSASSSQHTLLRRSIDLGPGIPGGVQPSPAQEVPRKQRARNKLQLKRPKHALEEEYSAVTEQEEKDYDVSGILLSDKNHRRKEARPGGPLNNHQPELSSKAKISITNATGTIEEVYEDKASVRSMPKRDRNTDYEENEDEDEEAELYQPNKPNKSIQKYDDEDAFEEEHPELPYNKQRNTRIPDHEDILNEGSIAAPHSKPHRRPQTMLHEKPKKHYRNRHPHKNRSDKVIDNVLKDIRQHSKNKDLRNYIRVRRPHVRKRFNTTLFNPEKEDEPSKMDDEEEEVEEEEYPDDQSLHNDLNHLDEATQDTKKKSQHTKDKHKRFKEHPILDNDDDDDDVNHDAADNDEYPAVDSDLKSISKGVKKFKKKVNGQAKFGAIGRGNTKPTHLVANVQAPKGDALQPESKDYDNDNDEYDYHNEENRDHDGLTQTQNKAVEPEHNDDNKNERKFNNNSVPNNEEKDDDDNENKPNDKEDNGQRDKSTQGEVLNPLKMDLINEVTKQIANIQLSMDSFTELMKTYSRDFLNFVPTVVPELFSEYRISSYEDDEDEYDKIGKSQSEFRTMTLYLFAKQEALDEVYSRNVKDILAMYAPEEVDARLTTLIANVRQAFGVEQALKTAVVALRQLDISHIQLPGNFSEDTPADHDTSAAPVFKRKAKLYIRDQVARYLPNIEDIKQRRVNSDTDGDKPQLILDLGKHRLFNLMIYKNLHKLLRHLNNQLKSISNKKNEDDISKRSLPDSALFDNSENNISDPAQYATPREHEDVKLMLEKLALQYGKYAAYMVTSDFTRDVRYLYRHLRVAMEREFLQNKDSKMNGMEINYYHLYRLASKRLKTAIKNKMRDLPVPGNRSQYDLYKTIAKAIHKKALPITKAAFTAYLRNETSELSWRLKSLVYSTTHNLNLNEMPISQNNYEDEYDFYVATEDSKKNVFEPPEYLPTAEPEDYYDSRSGFETRLKTGNRIKSKSVNLNKEESVYGGEPEEWKYLTQLMEHSTLPPLETIDPIIEKVAQQQSSYISDQVSSDFNEELRYVYRVLNMFDAKTIRGDLNMLPHPNELLRLVAKKIMQYIRYDIPLEVILQDVGIQDENISDQLLKEFGNMIFKASTPIAVKSFTNVLRKEVTILMSKSISSSRHKHSSPEYDDINHDDENDNVAYNDDISSEGDDAIKSAPHGRYGLLQIQPIDEGFQVGEERVNIVQDIVRPAHDVLKSLHDTKVPINIFDYNERVKSTDSKTTGPDKDSRIITYIGAKLLEDLINNQADQLTNNSLDDEQKIAIILSRYYLTKKAEDSLTKQETYEVPDTTIENTNNNDNYNNTNEGLTTLPSNNQGGELSDEGDFKPNSETVPPPESNKLTRNKTRKVKPDKQRYKLASQESDTDELNMSSTSSGMHLSSSTNKELSDVTDKKAKHRYERVTDDPKSKFHHKVRNTFGRRSNPLSNYMVNDYGEIETIDDKEELLPHTLNKKHKPAKSIFKPFFGKAAKKHRVALHNQNVNNGDNRIKSVTKLKNDRKGFGSTQIRPKNPSYDVDTSGPDLLQSDPNSENTSPGDAGGKRTKASTRYKTSNNNGIAMFRSFKPYYNKVPDRYKSMLKYQDVNNEDYDDNDVPVPVAKLKTHHGSANNQMISATSSDSEILQLGQHPRHPSNYDDQPMEMDMFRTKDINAQRLSKNDLLETRSFKPYYGKVPDRYKSMLKYQDVNNKDYDDNDVPVAVAKLNTHHEGLTTIYGSADNPKIDATSSDSEVLQLGKHPRHPSNDDDQPVEWDRFRTKDIKHQKQNTDGLLESRAFKPYHGKVPDRYKSMLKYQDVNNEDYDDNDVPVPVAKLNTHHEVLTSTHGRANFPKKDVTSFDPEFLVTAPHRRHPTNDDDQPIEIGRFRANGINSSGQDKYGLSYSKTFKPYHGKVPDKYKSMLKYQDENNKDYDDNDVPVAVAKLNTHHEGMTSTHGRANYPKIDVTTYDSEVLQVGPHPRHPDNFPTETDRFRGEDIKSYKQNREYLHVPRSFKPVYGRIPERYKSNLKYQDDNNGDYDDNDIPVRVGKLNTNKGSLISTPGSDNHFMVDDLSSNSEPMQSGPHPYHLDIFSELGRFRSKDIKIKKHSRDYLHVPRAFKPVYGRIPERYKSNLKYQDDNNGDYDDSDIPVRVGKLNPNTGSFTSTHGSVKYPIFDDLPSGSEPLQSGPHSYHSEIYDNFPIELGRFRTKDIKSKKQISDHLHEPRAFKPFYGKVPERYKSSLKYQDENNQDYDNNDSPVAVAKLNTHKEMLTTTNGRANNPKIGAVPTNTEYLRLGSPPPQTKKDDAVYERDLNENVSTTLKPE